VTASFSLNSLESRVSAVDSTGCPFFCAIFSKQNEPLMEEENTSRSPGLCSYNVYLPDIFDMKGLQLGKPV
jgi:hypothetical protein